MTRQKIILTAVALALIGGTAGVLAHLKTHQRLGAPGVKTRPLAGSTNPVVVEVVLPASVLDYTSEVMTQSVLVTQTLPPDTSFGSRRYVATNNSWMDVNVVLMGTDRTSIHKPQYCLEGAGWSIDHAATRETTIALERPQPYDLPVIKMVSTRHFADAKGQQIPWRGIYVYWFVADGALSGEITGRERMWWMTKEMFRTGTLQRWAYVSCFMVCPPGYEDATFERMKKFIVASVPEFQLTPKPREAIAAARP
jgi:hypothetical protein